MTRFSCRSVFPVTLLWLALSQAGMACGPQGTTLISQVKGSGQHSPLAGQQLSVEGVVTAILPDSKGFFLQEEDADQDQDASTAEGLFVYSGQLSMPLQRGDVLRVSGKVEEFSGQIQLHPQTASGIEACGRQPLPSAQLLQLPLPASAQWQHYEGMLVRLAQPLYVVDHHDYARYGELTLSSQPRLWTPTQKYRPGSAAAQALLAANLRDRLLLDDGQSRQNLDAWLPAPGGLSASNTLRAGDRLDDVTGVVAYSFGKYRIQPLTTPQVSHHNPRPSAPARIAGSVRVASFNVLNFFNGDGSGADAPFQDPANRGAKSQADFLRQRSKIVSAIRGLNADIVGLMELENDGFGPQSAIQSLVSALNQDQPPATHYRLVDPGLARIGSDAITVGMLYRPARVKPAGKATVMAVGDATRNRPSLMQNFVLDKKGAPLSVVVSHLKSKGSACGVDDPDRGDGQGNCNLTRLRAVQDLLRWQQAAGLERPLLLIGDFNAYAREDPIEALSNAGLVNLPARWHGDGLYSFVFNGESGTLDHAFASPALAARTLAAGEWHINADEPNALEYGSTFKSPAQRQKYYAPDAYRSSDHDPLYIDIRS